jgi:YrbI family 3-deoxy-D-manno-octulosonate 8-phosphate phosphatase
MTRILALDIDGVMTDGTKTYDKHGEAISKNFCDIDFTAIKLFQARGWYVCFISSDIFNKGMAESRKIPFYHSRREDGSIDKVEQMNRVVGQFEHSDVIYVGDDIMDLEVMKFVTYFGGKCYCPPNAAPYLTRHYDVLNRAGGCGAVMALYDLLYEDNCSLR